jgi:predicted NBD/HSP70 family sugar kinase
LPPVAANTGAAPQFPVLRRARRRIAKLRVRARGGNAAGREKLEFGHGKIWNGSAWRHGGRMNSAALKKNNLFRVIQALKCGGPMTKPEIVRLTSLTSVSVHNFMNELCGSGLIAEEGTDASNGGRRASVYRFNGGCRHIMGVYIALRSITCGVFDLDFSEKFHIEKPIDLGADDVQSNIAAVLELIELAIGNSGVAPSEFAGIGVTVPGAVNRESGVILNLVNATRWQNIPIKSIIEESVGLPTIVDKDNCGIVLHYKWTALAQASQLPQPGSGIRTNSARRAGHAKGLAQIQAQSRANIAHISITDGIGAGLLVNGSLYRGGHHTSGEIGHMTVRPDGEPCNCGNRGCLEQYASNMAIVRAAERAMAAKSRLGIGDIIKAAQSGDPVALAIFTEAAECLVLGVTNMMRLFDPDEIVFDCLWLQQVPGIFALVANKVFVDTRFVARSDVKISMNDIDGLLIKGAATLQYDAIFGSADTCPLL